MDTLDAQALLAHTIATQEPDALPDTFVHDRDGSLTVAFAGSENTYTWLADNVGEMAADWRALGAAVPAAIADFVDTHRRVIDTIDGGGKAPPDLVIHDLSARELKAVWRDEKHVVIVDGIGDRGARAA